MNVQICEDLNSFSQAAAKWCERKTQEVDAQSLFVPAGQTPIALYQLWEQKKPSYLERLEFMQIDDVVSGPKSRLFQRFFENELPSFQKQMRYIDTAEKVADLGVLGLGLNGHIAFHEPGLGRDFYSGCVRLGNITCQSLGLEIGSWGLTYGAGAFLQTRGILIMVQGASKREILERLLSRDPQIPATYLLEHPDLTILADRGAHG